MADIRKSAAEAITASRRVAHATCPHGNCRSRRRHAALPAWVTEQVEANRKAAQLEGESRG